MKNWKDKVLGVFAGIGIMSLLMSSYSNQPQQYSTPESHVWQLKSTLNESGEGRMYAINVQTGEVRKFSRTYPSVKGQKWRDVGSDFIIMKEVSQTTDEQNK